MRPGISVLANNGATIMVSENREIRSGTSPVKTDLEDREQMARRALSEIELIGPAAVLENCCDLADRIAEKLMKAEPEDFDNRTVVVGLQGFLERAAAVLKKM
jgi:hypothetical protein